MRVWLEADSLMQKMPSTKADSKNRHGQAVNRSRSLQWHHVSNGIMCHVSKHV